MGRGGCTGLLPRVLRVIDEYGKTMHALGRQQGAAEVGRRLKVRAVNRRGWCLRIRWVYVCGYQL